MASPRRCRTTSLDAFRGARVPRTLLMIMALLLGSARGQQQCDDTCGGWFINNGECNDGGPGSEYSVCPYGTDCTDCKRPPADRPADNSPPRCPSPSLRSRLALSHPLAAFGRCVRSGGPRTIPPPALPPPPSPPTPPPPPDIITQIMPEVVLKSSGTQIEPGFIFPADLMQRVADFVASSAAGGVSLDLTGLGLR